MTAARSRPALRSREIGGECSGLLLCLAHAGAGASSFNGWMRHVPRWLGLVRVQLPGREDLAHLAPRRCVHDIVASLRPELAALPEMPIAIYGHSMGAIVGFELARAMRRGGMRAPVGLYVSARRAPQLPLSHAPLYTLPDDELLEVFSRMGAPSLAALQKPEWREALMTMIRADLKVSDAYRYTADEPLRSPVFAFRGEGDVYVSDGEMAQWGEQSAQEFHMETLSGRHFFSSEGRARLIEAIVDDLRRRMALEATA